MVLIRSLYLRGRNRLGRIFLDDGKLGQRRFSKISQRLTKPRIPRMWLELNLSTDSISVFAITPKFYQILKLGNGHNMT